MKTLILTLNLFFSSFLVNPEVKTEFKSNGFLGSWHSDGSDYSMLITEKNGQLEIYNYFFNKSVVDNVKKVELHTVEEKVVRFTRKKMKTTIFYVENNHRVQVKYKLINETKMKAIFKGDWNGTIYYNKQNN